MVRGVPTPAFGQADLSNCEREQIQLAGSIQPHGALLVLREPDLLVIQASDNAADFLELDRDVLGLKLGAIRGNLADHIRPHLSDPLNEIPRAVRCQGRAFLVTSGDESAVLFFARSRSIAASIPITV